MNSVSILPVKSYRSFEVMITGNVSDLVKFKLVASKAQRILSSIDSKMFISRPVIITFVKMKAKYLKSSQS